MSCLALRPSDGNDDSELSGPDITDKTFKISMINSNNMNPKTFAQYDHQITDNQCTKEECNLPGFKCCSLLILMDMQSYLGLYVYHTRSAV